MTLTNSQFLTPTSSPETPTPQPHLNLLIGSFHLLFWLIFHPSAWQQYVAGADPPLPPDFTLVSLSRAHRHSSVVRRVLGYGYLILPLLVSLATGLVLWWRGVPPGSSLVVPVFYVLAINLALALIIGAVISVAAGITGGATIALAAGVVASLPAPIGGAGVPLAMALAIGLTGSVAVIVINYQPVQPSPPTLSPKTAGGLQAQIGGVVVGVLVGVVAVAGLRLALTGLASLTTGLAENTAYWLSRMLVVGSSFALAAAWRQGRWPGLAGGSAVALVYGLAAAGIQTEFFQHTGFLVSSGLVVGLASGLLFGTSLGVTVVLPYTLSEKIGGAWAGAWAGTLGSWGRHIVRNQIPLWPTLPLGLAGLTLGLTQSWWRPVLLYPLAAAWNLILYRLELRRGRRSSSLLRWHSAFWDEFQRLPLTGLDDHLLLVIDRYPAEGQATLAALSQSPQRWAAHAVQIELEARRLAQPSDVTTLARLHRHSPPGELADPLLRQFSHMSQDIEAALNQTTVYHQRLSLKSIVDRLNTLERELTSTAVPNAPRFYPIAGHWRRLVSHHLQQLATALEQSREIDNPYIVGVPLTAQQEIFVGRTDIVARIEQLLLDPRRPPLLLYGQRRMGKTSLLRNLGRLLPRSIVPLFVDGQRIALAGDYADFLYNLAREITKSASQQRGLTLPPLSPEALAAQPFTRFDAWLDTLEQTLHREGFQTALLALDEFEMLEQALVKGRFDEADVLSLLRHMIQHRPAFKVMLTGSHPLAEFERWAGYLINVQVIKLGYLAPAEARQLIEQPIKDFPLRYRPDACQRVLALTRGHPALIQLLCYELVALKNEQPPASRHIVELADVETAVPQALRSGQFFFIDIQQNQVDAAGLALLRYLAAQGPGAVVARARLLEQHPLPHDSAAATLDRLLQRDVIEAVPGGYRFQVELIRRWFANRTPRDG